MNTLIMKWNDVDQVIDLLKLDHNFSKMNWTESDVT